MALDSVLHFAKRCCACALTEGELAVDATTGNGHDTVFLAQTVGAKGHVYGFDVQEKAIMRTRDRLSAAAVASRATLIQAGHETMDHHLPAEAEGHVGAIMFNLGYLPGSDKTRITRAATTVKALHSAASYLKPDGVITVVQYMGHEGGRDEAHAVDAWAEALDQAQYQALRYQFVNQQNDPPRLLVVSRAFR
jgi:predicted methyltransferase